MKQLLSTLVLLLSATVVVAQPSNACNQGWAQYPRSDPRNPWVICIPEFGEMPISGLGSQYYGNIWSLPGLNKNGCRNWAITHLLDTLIRLPPVNAKPVEVFLYQGERGRLPDPKNYQRIGPREINSRSWLVAAGMWDGSRFPALAVGIQILGDTSYGNVGADYDLNQFVVFWPDSSGQYSIDDTTRLSCGEQTWFGPWRGLSMDADNDGVEDLITFGGGGFSNGAPVKKPYMRVWRGHDHKKWGHDGIGRMYDWGWQYSPAFDKVIDADGDGVLDLTGQTAGSQATAYVLYGNKNGFPDTSALQRINLNEAAHCGTSVFSDVTGDGIPDLVALSGGSGENTVKVYVGRRGQRLLEQFGSGAEPPHPDSVEWWGKPWAEVWQPYRVNNYWIRNDAIYDLGDANADGINDIWSQSGPFVIEYNTADKLDSMIDGIIDYESTEYIGLYAVLGDIDGSGSATYVISNGSSIIRFYKPTKALQLPYIRRLLPPDSAVAEVPSMRDARSEMLSIVATPNPSHGTVELRWDSGLLGEAVITFSNINGTAIAEVRADAASGHCTVSTNEIPRGHYFIVITTKNAQGSTQLTLL